jgi:uncharacterized DUF497 family protein
VRFEWDEEKEKANLKKHRVSFLEAQTVFLDPLAVTITDPDHSIGEKRFIDIGESVESRVLIVSYTERSSAIRIISARIASPAERRHYEKGNK